MKKLLTLTLALALLAAFSGLATAATTVKSSESYSSERVATDKASLLNGKVTKANNKANTFTVALVFSAAKLSMRPTVGKFIDFTYNPETPGGGPMEASNLNFSKSNAN